MNTIIQTPTPDLKSSMSFYSTLGFIQLPMKAAVMFSDGKCLIEVNSDRFARTGVKLYRENWDETLLKELKNIGNLLKIENGYLLCDASGTWIYLLNDRFDSSFKIDTIGPSVLGNNAGLSIETPDIKRSHALWKLLGFDNETGELDQGWVSLMNEDNITISLMKPNTCPHLFFNPSLTFFNGEENLAIIKRIKELNIPITEEITHFNKEGKVDNIIIRDPGGLGFFLFND